MQITVEELAKNQDRYFDMLGERDIFITKNGKYVAKLTNIKPRNGVSESLFGILPADVDLDKERVERFQENNQ